MRSIRRPSASPARCVGEHMKSVCIPGAGLQLLPASRDTRRDWLDWPLAQFPTRAAPSWAQGPLAGQDKPAAVQDTPPSAVWKADVSPMAVPKITSTALVERTETAELNWCHP